MIYLKKLIYNCPTALLSVECTGLKTQILLTLPFFSREALEEIRQTWKELPQTLYFDSKWSKWKEQNERSKWKPSRGGKQLQCRHNGQRSVPARCTGGFLNRGTWGERRDPPGTSSSHHSGWGDLGGAKSNGGQASTFIKETPGEHHEQCQQTGCGVGVCVGGRTGRVF